MSGNKDLELEKQLVEAAQQDPDQFVHLYDKYFDQIYRYIYRRVSGNRETAHDIASQTFLDAFSHLKNFKWQGFPFSSWLYKIAHNNVIKWYRKDGKQYYVPIEEAYSVSDKNPNQKQQLNAQLDSDLIKQILSKLEDDEQEIIRLKFFEGVSNIEIAEIMGLSITNIGVKVFRALKKAKGYLPTKDDFKQFESGSDLNNIL